MIKISNLILGIFPNRKKIAILSGIILALFGITLNYTYRAYIYRHGYYDYHIADTIGSIFCVPAGTFFCYGILKKSFVTMIKYVTIGNLLYELLALTQVHGTFDVFDLLAICLGACMTYIFSKFIFYKFKRLHDTNRF